MNGRPKMLLISPAMSTFVRRDAEWLGEHFDVVEIEAALSSHPLKLVIALIAIFFRVLKSMHSVQFVYTWFTDYHSPLVTLLAACFRKPVYTVVGGYEVNCLPALNYGGLKNPLRRWAIRFSLNRARCVLPVSEYTAGLTRQLIDHDRVQVVYNGVPPLLQSTAPPAHKTGFLTVALIGTAQAFYLKGIDKFFDMARHFPESNFTLVGVSPGFELYRLSAVPANVTVRHRLSQTQLATVYASAKYYVQLSETESFGVAVLEALAHGAMPIVSGRGALPELFGSCALKLDVDAASWESTLADLHRRLSAFDVPPEAAQAVLERFTLERRFAVLSQALEEEMPG